MRTSLVVGLTLVLVAAACFDSGETATTPTSPSSTTTVTSESETTTSSILEGAIDPATGGTVVSADGSVTVDIPPGALSEPTLIEIGTFQGDLGDAGVVVGPVYDLQPSGTTFAQPVTVTRRFEGAVVDGRVPLILQSVGTDGTWTPLASPSISVDGDTVVSAGTLDHFSGLAGLQLTEGDVPVFFAIAETDDADVGDFFVFKPHTLGPESVALNLGLRQELVDFGGPGNWEPVDPLVPEAIQCIVAGGPVLAEAHFNVEVPAGTFWGDARAEIIPGAPLVDFDLLFDVSLPGCEAGTVPDLHVEVAFEAIPSNTDQPCTSGFSDSVSYFFTPGDDRDGTMFFPFEFQQGLGGRPFIQDGSELKSEGFDFGNPGGDFSDTFVIDLDTGTGYQLSEFSGNVCRWDIAFTPPIIPTVIDIIELDLPSPSGGTCVPNDVTLCLQDDRFRVEIDWSTGLNSGPGVVMPIQPNDAGLFFFSDPGNWELLLKVLNGCDFNGHYWVFFAAATNVEYTVTVTDTTSGTAKAYDNPLGNPAPAITDTAAFATCP